MSLKEKVEYVKKPSMVMVVGDGFDTTNYVKIVKWSDVADAKMKLLKKLCLCGSCGEKEGERFCEPCMIIDEIFGRGL